MKKDRITLVCCARAFLFKVWIEENVAAHKIKRWNKISLEVETTDGYRYIGVTRVEKLRGFRCKEVVFVGPSDNFFDPCWKRFAEIATMKWGK